MTVKQDVRFFVNAVGLTDIDRACDFITRGTPADEGTTMAAEKIADLMGLYSLEELIAACEKLFDSGGGGTFERREAFRRKLNPLCTFFRRLGNERELATATATPDQLTLIHSRDPREAFRACGMVLDRASRLSN